MNPRRLRILHLEDSDADHLLALMQMRRGGLDVHSLRVDSELAFTAALAEPWDLVLSDYNLPGFSGLLALDLLRARTRLVPFVLLSGQMGEDMAVEAMRKGANDYLLKNNLIRLIPEIGRAHV